MKSSFFTLSVLFCSLQVLHCATNELEYNAFFARNARQRVNPILIQNNSIPEQETKVNGTRGFTLTHQIKTTSVEQGKADENIQYYEYPNENPTGKNIIAHARPKGSNNGAHHQNRKPQYISHKNINPKHKSAPQNHQKFNKNSHSNHHKAQAHRGASRAFYGQQEYDQSNGMDQDQDQGQYDTGNMAGDEQYAATTASPDMNQQQELPQTFEQPAEQGAQEQATPQESAQNSQPQEMPVTEAMPQEATQPANMQNSFTTQAAVISTQPYVATTQPPNVQTPQANVQPGNQYCPEEIESLGCFNAFQPGTGPFTTLITQKTQTQTLEDFMCLCGTMVQSKGWFTFVLQQDKCFSGPQETGYDQNGPTETCVNDSGAVCTDADTYCQGGEGSMSVYSIITPAHKRVARH